MQEQLTRLVQMILRVQTQAPGQISIEELRHEAVEYERNIASTPMSTETRSHLENLLRNLNQMIEHYSILEVIPFLPERNEILRPLQQVETSTPIDRAEFELLKDAFTTFMKQVYGQPVTLPPSLVINNVVIPFVTLAEIQTNQIERWIVDPLTQPWAGPPGTPYRIYTFFTKDGKSYLVRAKYDPSTNQLLP